MIMRKMNIIRIVCASFLFSACDVLDKEPIAIVPENKIWNDKALVDANLTYLYSAANWNSVLEDVEAKHVNITDEARECFVWGTIQKKFTLGDIQPGNINDDPWIGLWGYDFIRDCNDFIEHIETCPFEATWVNQKKSEARFLRAMHYFNLGMRYGGVPLITHVQQLGDEDLFPKRNTEDEIYDFVLKELDDIASILPDSYGASEKGRVSRYAALALKSRAMLYAGSIAKYGEIQMDGILGVPKEKANFYFEESAKASKEIIDSPLFKLYNKYPDDKVKNYQNLFLEKDNSEVIMAKKFTLVQNGHNFDYNNLPISYKPFVGSSINPTLELVDEYQFVDGTPGKTINYNQEISTAKLYKNKEPRFHASILYNEAEFLDDKIETYYFTIQSDIKKDKRDKKKRGKDVNDNNAGGTQTGFLIKKYLSGKRDMPTGGYSDTDFIIFRLGEIYLNYSEALLQLNTAEGLKTGLFYLNEIRKRAGVPDRQVLTLDWIKHERRIELAFEGLRYWDVRRWRIAHTALSGVFHKLTTYYISSRKTYGYLIENCQGKDVRKFLKKHYYLPFKRVYCTENPNLKQNPEYPL